MSLKNSVTPPVIDPGTARLVAQRLNHCVTPGPPNFVTKHLLNYWWGGSLEPPVYTVAIGKYADRLDTVSWGFHTHCKVKVLCYVRLPTDTHSWFHVRRSFHKIRQNCGVLMLHNSTITYVHVHNMTYTRRTFWYRGELCSFGSRCGVNTWFAIHEWAVFTQMIHFQPSVLVSP